MERLTNKKIGIVVKGTISEEVKERALIYEKLQQLENIEEELGIDLITLFKALKEDIYYKDCSTIIKVYVLGISPMRENKFALECYYDFKNFRVDTRDYGKTFALTKEELENE